MNNTICPDWYLNRGPLDLQSNTLPLYHGGCWHLVLITLVGLFNDSFAISWTAYLLSLISNYIWTSVLAICVTDLSTIMRDYVCDGYADCSDGEDEDTRMNCLRK